MCLYFADLDVFSEGLTVHVWNVQAPQGWVGQLAGLHKNFLMAFQETRHIAEEEKKCMMFWGDFE